MKLRIIITRTSEANRRSSGRSSMNKNKFENGIIGAEEMIESPFESVCTMIAFVDCYQHYWFWWLFWTRTRHCKNHQRKFSLFCFMLSLLVHLRETQHNAALYIYVYVLFINIIIMEMKTRCWLCCGIENEDMIK